MSRVIKSDEFVVSPPRQLSLPKRVVSEKPAKKAVVEETVATAITVDVQTEDPQQAARKEADGLLETAKLEVQTMLENAEADARKKTDEATAQAAEIVAQAVAEAEKLKEIAKNEGINQGREEIRSELTEMLAQAAKMLGEAEQLRNERIVSSEEELLRLSVSIAKKIIGTQLELDPQIIKNIVIQALQTVMGAEKIRIKLSKEDVDVFQSLTDNQELREILSDTTPLHIETLSKFERGDCSIETDIGNVDARIKLQLERIMTELFKVGQI